MKIRGRKIFVGAACVSLAAVLGLAASSHFFVKSNNICKGVTVAGVDLSGYSKEQAKDTLRQMAIARRESKVRIVVEDQIWSAAAADLGANVDWQASLDNAMKIGRTGNIANRIRDLVSGPSKSKTFSLEVRCDPNVLKKTVNKIAKDVDRPAVNAALNISTTPFTITAEKTGIKIAKESAIEIISKELAAGSAQIHLSPVVDKPRITAVDLQSIDSVLSKYSTTFVASNINRTHNLKVATANLNKTILMPGDEFSYNKAVGERVESRGFRNAIIFVKGMMEDGVGGGICQVSSTLYNVALLAGLKISERHPHSRTVVYVPVGRDATVVYGYRDFKFVNSGKYPVYIHGTLSGNTLSMTIYGSSSDKKTVTVYNGQTTYTPISGTKTVIDPTIPPGTTKVTDKGSRGVSTVVYRKITESNGKEKVDIVSRDRYPAQQVIMATNPVKPEETKPAVKPESTASVSPGNL